MNQNLSQQLHNILDHHTSFCIVLPPHPSLDAVVSSVVFTHALERMGKQVITVSEEFSLTPQMTFFPNITNIHSSIPLAHQINMILDTKNQIDSNILTEIPVSVDSIITLDTPTLDSLGSLFTRHANFFHQTPIINIDHHPENEHFGQINVVSLKKSSIAEILAILFALWEHKSYPTLSIDDATLLLAGILSKTRCFRHHAITPYTLQLAAHLTEIGAQYHDILRHLYQSKTLPILKLWGRILSMMETNQTHNLVWSVLESYDIEDVLVSQEEIQELIDELLWETPDVKHVMIGFPTSQDETSILISTNSDIITPSTFAEFHPQKNAHHISLTMHGTPHACMQRARAIMLHALTHLT